MTTKTHKSFLEKALAVTFYAIALTGLAVFQYHTKFFWG